MRTPTESKTFARLPVPDGCLDDCETIIVSVNGRKRNWQTSNPRRREFSRPQRELRETRLLSPLSRPLSRRSTLQSQQAIRLQQRRASARQSARSPWRLPRAFCTRTLLPARCLASRSLSQQSANRCHRTKAKAEWISALLFSCRFLLISVVRTALDNLNHISVNPIHNPITIIDSPAPVGR